MTKINNFWVDNNGNRWDSYMYTEEVAIEHSNTMNNCYGCYNSSNCENCNKMINSINCYNCRSCSNCSNCSNCYKCSFVSDANSCRNCSSCSDCNDCYNCNNVKDSRSCSGCNNIRFCYNCYDCNDYQANPNRIISKNIGSRKSQTIVYILDGNVQVICGCFRGDLKTFEEAVLTTHADNEHKDEYLEFIKLVNHYIEYLEN